MARKGLASGGPIPESASKAPGTTTPRALQAWAAAPPDPRLPDRLAQRSGQSYDHCLWVFVLHRQAGQARDRPGQASRTGTSARPCGRPRTGAQAARAMATASRRRGLTRAPRSAGRPYRRLWTCGPGWAGRRYPSGAACTSSSSGGATACALNRLMRTAGLGQDAGDPLLVSNPAQSDLDPAGR